MTTPAETASPLHGEVLFYKNPQPLNIETHATLGLNSSTTPFAFARNAHAVPVIVGEFGPASLSYPLIFAGADYQPLAVMSIRPNENLFINEQGLFPDGVYVPAFIRRYPFVFANVTDQNQLVVCIDRGADIVAENAEVPFFDNGQPSAFTQQCMDFCANFEGERRKTDDFVKVVRDLDLFELREVNFTPRNPDGSNGPPTKISEHFSPSVERVNALSDKDKLQLLNSGAMQQIQLHWNSLLNWERLVNETMRRFPDQPAAGNA
jgi:hypothetical protein